MTYPKKKMVNIRRRSMKNSLTVKRKRLQENLIDLEEFTMMKKDVVLVNTARGGIVKEGDLYQFLKNNSEAFAAFDVFKKEPVFNSKLFKLPNFFASSHRASLTNEGIFNMGIAAIDGLLKK